MALSIGIDVGGTKIAAGVVDEQGTVIETNRRSSPATSRDAIVETIVAMARDLLARHDARTIGIGAAGFVDADRNTIAYGTNLDWTGLRLADAVSEQVHIPVVVENDANAFGWAEARFGAARGASHALIAAIGTGLGGAIVSDGQLLRGGRGFAAEIGHITVVPGGRPCGCGLRGCLERYASGTALAANAWELASFRPQQAARLLELAGGNPAQITGKTVASAAREGDPAALECFAEFSHWLGVGLGAMCSILDPEIIVVAGGLADSGDLFLDQTREAFVANLTARQARPEIPIVLAQGGSDAGLVGAADVARTLHETGRV